MNSELLKQVSDQVIGNTLEIQSHRRPSHMPQSKSQSQQRDKPGIELPSAQIDVNQEDSASKRKERAMKSRKLKKILKERLNINCLRMLGEDSDQEEVSYLHNQTCKTDTSARELPRKRMLHCTSDRSPHQVLIKQILHTGVSVQLDTSPDPHTLDDFQEVFSVRDLLGVGAYGVVLLVKNKITGEKSALKIINKDKLSSRALSILKNESTIMQTMNHPSVVSFKRIFENQRFVIIEMEYVQGGQLKRLHKLDQALTDVQAAKVMKSILEGVAYIHERSIIHRDLKPENLLLKTTDDSCTDVKIVDFGLSAVFNLRQGKAATEKAGTLLYMSPEQVKDNNYTKKVDMWACGIIMYQLLTKGEHPCYKKGSGCEAYLSKLENIATEPIQWNFQPNFSPLAKDLFLKLCSFPSNQRYDALTALQHPWITRNLSAHIPLTHNEHLMRFDAERDLRKLMRVAYFAAQTQVVKPDRLPKQDRPQQLFQQRSFQEYKELLMKESSKSMDSTSADSQKQEEQPCVTEGSIVAGKQICETPKGSVSSQYSLSKAGRSWTLKKQKTRSVKRKKTIITKSSSKTTDLDTKLENLKQKPQTTLGKLPERAKGNQAPRFCENSMMTGLSRFMKLEDNRVLKTQIVTGTSEQTDLEQTLKLQRLPNTSKVGLFPADSFEKMGRNMMPVKSPKSGAAGQRGKQLTKHTVSRYPSSNSLGLNAYEQQIQGKSPLIQKSDRRRSNLVGNATSPKQVFDEPELRQNQHFVSKYKGYDQLRKQATEELQYAAFQDMDLRDVLPKSKKSVRPGKKGHDNKQQKLSYGASEATQFRRKHYKAQLSHQEQIKQAQYGYIRKHSQATPINKNYQMPLTNIDLTVKSPRGSVQIKHAKNNYLLQLGGTTKKEDPKDKIVCPMVSLGYNQVYQQSKKQPSFNHLKQEPKQFTTPPPKKPTQALVSEIVEVFTQSLHKQQLQQQQEAQQPMLNIKGYQSVLQTSHSGSPPKFPHQNSSTQIMLQKTADSAVFMSPSKHDLYNLRKPTKHDDHSHLTSPNMNFRRHKQRSVVPIVVKGTEIKASNSSMCLQDLVYKHNSAYTQEL